MASEKEQFAMETQEAILNYYILLQKETEKKTHIWKKICRKYKNNYEVKTKKFDDVIHRASLDDKNNNLETKNKELKNMLEEKIKLQQEHDDRMQENTILIEKIKSENEELKDMLEEKIKLQQEHDDRMQENMILIEKLKLENEKLEKQLEDKKNNYSKMDKELEEKNKKLEKENKMLSKNLEVKVKKEKISADAQKKIKLNEQKIAELSAVNEKYKEEINTYVLKIKELEKAVEEEADLKIKLGDENKENVKMLKRDLEHSENLIKELQNKIEKNHGKGENDLLAKQINEEKKKNQKLIEEMEQLRKLVEDNAGKDNLQDNEIIKNYKKKIKLLKKECDKKNELKIIAEAETKSLLQIVNNYKSNLNDILLENKNQMKLYYEEIIKKDNQICKYETENLNLINELNGKNAELDSIKLLYSEVVKKGEEFKKIVDHEMEQAGFTDPTLSTLKKLHEGKKDVVKSKNNAVPSNKKHISGVSKVGKMDIVINRINEAPKSKNITNNGIVDKTNEKHDREHVELNCNSVSLNQKENENIIPLINDIFESSTTTTKGSDIKLLKPAKQKEKNEKETKTNRKKMLSKRKKVAFDLTYKNPLIKKVKKDEINLKSKNDKMSKEDITEQNDSSNENKETTLGLQKGKKCIILKNDKSNVNYINKETSPIFKNDKYVLMKGNHVLPGNTNNKELNKKEKNVPSFFDDLTFNDSSPIAKKKKY